MKTFPILAACIVAALAVGMSYDSLADQRIKTKSNIKNDRSAQTEQAFVEATPEDAESCKTASGDGGGVSYSKGINGGGLARTAGPSDASSGIAAGRRIELCTSAQSAVDRINASQEESQAMVDALSRNDTATMQMILVRNGLSLEDADAAQRGTHFKSVTIKRGSNACDGAVCESDPSSGSSASRFKITLTIKLSKPVEISVSFEK